MILQKHRASRSPPIKGPFAYRETTRLPLYMTHPDVRGGQGCRALSGHIDLVPTLLGMAGVEPGRLADFAGRPLPGKDLTPLLASPGAAGTNALRESVLFTYSGLSTNDASLWQAVARARAAGQDPRAEPRRQGFAPDLKQRGSLRAVFDGRHRFTRYFAPIERNRPATLDALYRWNDVELLDLEADPAEIGADDRREMPDFPRIDWTLTPADL